MVARAALGLVVLLAAGALAGCASNAGGSGSDLQLADGKRVDLDAAAQNAQSGAGKGTVSGVVVDEGIHPIPDANVTVASKGIAVRGDKDGIFVIPNLEPGLYTLQVRADGFLPIQTSAEVKAGETAKVRVVMQAHFVPKPYHGATTKFKGFYQASSGFADEVLDLAVWNHTYGPVTLPNGCTCRFTFGADLNVTTMVLEITWDQSIDNGPYHPLGGGWTFDITDDKGDGPLQFCENTGSYEPPCVIHEQAVGNFSANSQRYHVGIWSDASWVYVNENFEVFATPFYVAPAPAGWSAIKGDA